MAQVPIKYIKSKSGNIDGYFHSDAADKAEQDASEALDTAKQSAEDLSTATVNLQEQITDAIEDMKQRYGNAIVFKGAVETFDDLPKKGETPGDLYLVTSTSDEYIWDGSNWEKLGSVIDYPVTEVKTSGSATLTAETDSETKVVTISDAGRIDANTAELEKCLRTEDVITEAEIDALV